MRTDTAAPRGPEPVVLIPCLVVDNPEDAVRFYGLVFGAVPADRAAGAGTPTGAPVEIPVRLGNTQIVVTMPGTRAGLTDPRHLPGTPVLLRVHMADPKGVFARALASGARPLRPVADQPEGERTGWFEDPFGHHWEVAGRAR